jgi:hypothetical protein
MTKETHHPLKNYHDDITDITSRFSFTHHPVLDTSGLIVVPQGFAQPFYHKPTNTIGVLFSKTAHNLRGETQSNGKIYAKADAIKNCYIFGARRAKGDKETPLRQRANAHTVKRELREDLDKSRRILGLRSRKHFTLYNADNLYTNGRHVYEILPRKNDGFNVVLRLSTRRQDGSFVPFDLNDKSLRGHFAKASTTIAHTKTLTLARLAVSAHWRKLSADLWEEKNIFMNTSKPVFAKKLLANVVHGSYEKAPKIVASTTIVGAILGIEYGLTLGVTAGLVTGFTAAAAHTAIHLPVEMGLEEYVRARARSKEAKLKLEIDAYGFDADVSDHFKIQTPENIAKLCPHIDLERFNAKDFELLSLEQFSLLKDREQVQDNLQAVGLAGHVMFMGQRGFSSEASIADLRTEMRIFQTGIVRFMHEKPNGNIVVFAQYCPEHCNNEQLRLPQHYIDQFNNGIIRLEYDRTKSTFPEGLLTPPENISYKEMTLEIERDLLFSQQTDISWDTRCKSIQNIYNAFTNMDSLNAGLRKNKHPIATSLRAYA